MSQSTDKATTFGATIVKTVGQETDLLPPQPLVSTKGLTPRTSHEAPSVQSSPAAEYQEQKFPVYSPFYQHPPASFERVHSRQNSKIFAVGEKDLESGAVTPSAHNDDNPFTSKISIDCNKECKMWPSKQTLKETRLAQKKKRHQERGCCACGTIRTRWLELSKKQRLAIEIVIAIFIIGVIIAVAVGVTKAVNGQVYKSDGNSRPLDHQ